MREANHEAPVRQISSGEADPVQSLHHPCHCKYCIPNLPSPSFFPIHSCPLVLLLFDNRAAKITSLSKRLQRLNPQLTPALVPAVGTGGSRATDVLSTFQGSKSGFSSSVNPPVVKELIGGRLSSQQMTSWTAECRRGSETLEVVNFSMIWRLIFSLFEDNYKKNYKQYC